MLYAPKKLTNDTVQKTLLRTLCPRRDCRCWTSAWNRYDTWHGI